MVSVMLHGVVELREKATNQPFLVNGQHVKYYYGEDTSHDEKAVDLANNE